MHGGDNLFGRMTTHVYRDSGVDAELDHKAHKVTEKLSESINTIANEPSVAFYRIQEHVRKTLPQLVEQKHEVEEVQQLVQGACFDTEYAGNAVKGMKKSVVHFQNTQDLLKNAMFMKQQIDYEEARKKQSRMPPGNGKQEGPPGNKTEEGTNDMADSAVSTDSSLAASGHANTEEDSKDCSTDNGGTEASATDDQIQTENSNQETTPEESVTDDKIQTENSNQETTPEESVTDDKIQTENSNQETTPEESVTDDKIQTENSNQEATPEESVTDDKIQAENSNQETMPEESATDDKIQTENSNQETKPEESATDDQIQTENSNQEITEENTEPSSSMQES